MKRILPLFLLAAAVAPAHATWTLTSETIGDTITATDGTWNLKLRRNGNGPYTCWNDSGTGGPVLDLTTFNEDMAAAGKQWNGYPITVTGINNEGFMNLTGLKEVRLPATVTSFGNQCFKNTGLEGEFVMPDSITTMGDAVFQNCKSLTRFVVNENIKTLSNTFFGCSALEEVKIASGTTTLSGSPFRACPSLVAVYADEADRAVGSVVLPATVTAIPGNCFYDDTSIERVVAPAVTAISGERAFQNCTALAEVVLPALQQFSSIYTFNSCTSLRRLEVPSCARLGQGTFFGCTALEEVYVSSALHTLGTDCFRDCTSFRTLYTNEATKVAGHVQLPATVTGTFGNYTFDGTKIERVDAPGVTGLVGERVFENCTLLEEAHLPSAANIACSYAFSGCPLLRVLEISPNMGGTIYASAFSGCNSLESVYQAGTEPVVGLFDFPAGVTKLEWGCFWNCKSMERFVGPGVVDIQKVRSAPDGALLAGSLRHPQQQQQQRPDRVLRLHVARGLLPVDDAEDQGDTQRPLPRPLRAHERLRFLRQHGRISVRRRRVLPVQRREEGSVRQASRDVHQARGPRILRHGPRRGGPLCGRRSFDERQLPALAGTERRWQPL